VTCRCDCHGRFEAPCTISGGCGHLHAADVMERPSSACRSCRPPKGTRPWKLAERGFFACEQCGDEMANNLEEIGQRYYLLSPMQGGMGLDGGRMAPGFESKAPGSDHIIVMRDHRSSDVAKVWVGGDGKIHREQDRPPLSVFGVLLTEAFDTAERRGLTQTTMFESVAQLTVFLARHLGWWSRQEDVGDFAERLRTLVNQLRPVTGAPRPKPFAQCPNVIELGDGETRVCGGPVYPPETLAMPVMECGGCGESWDRGNWEQLGQQMRSA
jgi:hypothetical protein